MQKGTLDINPLVMKKRFCLFKFMQTSYGSPERNLSVHLYSKIIRFRLPVLTLGLKKPSAYQHVIKSIMALSLLALKLRTPVKYVNIILPSSL